MERVYVAPVEIVMRSTTAQGTRAVLDLYPAGQIPPDPGEFMNAAVRELLLTLREGYDIVLVDAPPVLRVGDPLTLVNSSMASLWLDASE